MGPPGPCPANPRSLGWACSHTSGRGDGLSLQGPLPQLCRAGLSLEGKAGWPSAELSEQKDSWVQEAFTDLHLLHFFGRLSDRLRWLFLNKVIHGVIVAVTV